MKKQLFKSVSALKSEMVKIADDFFDHPEVGLKEVHASSVLCDRFEKAGFEVERGIAGLPTAFRAVYRHGAGGVRIGLLCEYDALAGLGHACGHHMQGPSVLAAAVALKNAEIGAPFTLVVYGTPAEETVSGKVTMIREGFFRDIDVALMMHGGGETTVDVKSMALSKFTVIYHGIAAHSAIRPEQGRSSLDAMSLAFHGVELLREHVKDDTRMHYNITGGGGTGANIVPSYTEAQFYVRSYNRLYLESVIERFFKVLNGAAMMTETDVEIIREKDLDNKIPAMKLNEVMMKNAREAEAPGICPPRTKTGSTDLGNIMQLMPGGCIRVAFVPAGTAAHSQEFLDAGKSGEAHDAIVTGAKVLAGTAYDLITVPGLMESISEEYRTARAEYERAAKA